VGTSRAAHQTATCYRNVKAMTTFISRAMPLQHWLDEVHCRSRRSGGVVLGQR
jgi:hypothetical protein